MPLFSSLNSPYFSNPHQLRDELIVKHGGAQSIDEFELSSYLTSSESSAFSSRASSPYFGSVTRDDMDVEMTNGTREHYSPIHSFQHAQVGAIDPRLLLAPCDGGIGKSVSCEPQRLRPRKATRASISRRLPEDDDEYLPSEGKERLKAKLRASPNHDSSKTASKCSRISSSPSPSGDASILRFRSRNKVVSTDAVLHELSRIVEKRTTSRRKSKDSSCELCGASFTRPSDLQRHVLTHDPSRTNSTVCIGLSLEEAMDYNVDYARLNRCHWKNEVRLGGCGKEFSRTDALLRHVKLNKSQCVLLRAGRLIKPAR